MKYGSTVLFVNDVRGVLEFYRKAFGFKTKFYDKEFDFGLLDAAGAEIGIASHRSGDLMMPGAYKKPGRGHPDGVEIAFYTSDVRGAFDRAVAAGAVSLAEPRRMSWNQTVAYVRSVEGTIIGFCTPVEAS